MEQILSALKYLHNKGVVHLNIKLDNILLDENNNIKISGFGISALLKEENNIENEEDEDLICHCSQVGRRDFVCPEIEKGVIYDYRCDIYSLGLTMLCLMTKDKPI